MASLGERRAGTLTVSPAAKDTMLRLETQAGDVKLLV
jgi:hypothetical protein